MATILSTLIPAKQAESSQTAQYTATGVVAVIDKFTVTNTSGINVTISVNIISSGGSAGSDNLILKEHTVPPGKTYNAPELVGQVLLASSFISTLASVASSLTIRCSGREIS